MPTPASVTDSIAAALPRDAITDVDNVTVECHGADVWLRGHVRSWTARARAETAAWKTPGVEFVHNDVSIDSPTVRSA
jgi:osmotically-inducible protein OsmY